MKRYSILLFIILLTGGMLFGQSSKNGTNAASELLVPVGAQYLGGGGAAAVGSGLEGLLWNPAALDQGQDNVLAMFSRRNYIADIGINYGAIGLRAGSFGALAIHLRSFDIGDIQRTDEFHMDGTGEVFTPTIFILGATYSKAMADRIRIGVTGNLINESFANVGGSSFSLDAGVQYNDFLSLTGLSIGVALRNIGTSMTYEGSALYIQGIAQGSDRQTTQYKVQAASAALPTVVDLSVNYVPITNLNVGFTYSENNYATNEGRIFGSYNLGDYATIRGSYVLNMESVDVLENIWAGPSFGASLNLQPLIGSNISVDYGFVPVDYFDANHIFTVRLGF